MRQPGKRRGRLIYLFEECTPADFVGTFKVVIDDSKYYAQIIYVEVFGLFLIVYLNKLPEQKLTIFRKNLVGCSVTSTFRKTHQVKGMYRIINFFPRILSYIEICIFVHILSYTLYNFYIDK